MKEIPDLIDLIERRIRPGTVIPKPKARGDFIVKGWGRRRGERALVYFVPNHKNPSRPVQKGITVSEWQKASGQLFRTGEFTGKWFREYLPDCHEEGTCNFTTIGGIFELLGIAGYAGPGAYRKT